MGSGKGQSRRVQIGYKARIRTAKGDIKNPDFDFSPVIHNDDNWNNFIARNNLRGTNLFKYYLGIDSLSAWPEGQDAMTTLLTEILRDCIAVAAIQIAPEYNIEDFALTIYEEKRSSGDQYLCKMEYLPTHTSYVVANFYWLLGQKSIDIAVPGVTYCVGWFARSLEIILLSERAKNTRR